MPPFLLRTMEEEYQGECNDVVKVVEECQVKVKDAGVSTERVMHLGCRTGRGSFELSRYFDKVGLTPVFRLNESCIWAVEPAGEASNSPDILTR